MQQHVRVWIQEKSENKKCFGCKNISCIEQNICLTRKFNKKSMSRIYGTKKSEVNSVWKDVINCIAQQCVYIIKYIGA